MNVHPTPASRALAAGLAALAVAAVAACSGSGSSTSTAVAGAAAVTASSSAGAGPGSTVSPSPSPSGSPASPTSTSASGPASSLEADYRRVIAAVLPSVVEIRTQQGLGSGVVLDGSGDIVTNAHVVGSATRFEVFLPGRADPVKATL